MSKAILLEPHYLPNVQYLSKFLLYDQVVIDDLQRYQKQSYRNRAQISGSNQVLNLTVPLVKGKTSQPVNKVQIDYKRNWQREHWESIRSAYGKAPYFDYYKDKLKQNLQNAGDCLLTFDLAMLESLLSMLQIPARHQLWSAFKGEMKDVADWRDAIHPKKEISDPEFQSTPYTQVFEDRWGFIENLSGIDLLFNEGPAAKEVLNQSIR